MATSTRGAAPLVRRLKDRSATGKVGSTKAWAEDQSVLRQQFRYLELPANTTSTIAVAFSSDGKRFASTHGDHTVKITSFSEGKVVQTLRGHPRTPWTVKFHPKDSRIVASGCLGFEVKVWNTTTGQCLHTAKLEVAIISLSFHPSGNVLAIASGQFVYLWDYNNKPKPYSEWGHPHIIRCVRFTPDGGSIIIGAANSSPSAPQAHNSTNRPPRDTGASVPANREVTFRLLVWDFNLEAAGRENRTAFSRPRVLLHQTLLYNDGGFDVSQDGLWLCAIAELWKAVSDPVVPLQSNGGPDSERTPPTRKPTAKLKQPTSPKASRGFGMARNDDFSAIDTSSSSNAARHSAVSTVSTVHSLAGNAKAAPQSESTAAVRELDRAVPVPIDTMRDRVEMIAEPSRRVLGKAEGEPAAVRASHTQANTDTQSIPTEDNGIVLALNGVQSITGSGLVKRETAMEVVGNLGGLVEGVAEGGNQGLRDAEGPVQGMGKGVVDALGNSSILQGNLQSTVPMEREEKDETPMAEPSEAEAFQPDARRRAKSPEGEKGRVFKPWPSRIGLWQQAEGISGSSSHGPAPRAVAWAGGERRGHDATFADGGSGSGSGGKVKHRLASLTPTASGRLDGNPRTPSPRISLKRCLSATWLNGGNAAGSSASGAGNGRSGERRGKSFSRTGATTKRAVAVGTLGGRWSGGASRVHQHAQAGEATDFPRPPLRPSRDSPPAYGVQATGAFQSSMLPSNAAAGSEGGLRIALPQQESPAAARCPAAAEVLVPDVEGEATATTAAVQQEQQEDQPQNESGAAAGDRPLQLLTPPPLFFLQVPAAGALRRDTPWAGGPVRRRPASVFAPSVHRHEARAAAGAAGEVASVSVRARALADSLANASADEVHRRSRVADPPPMAGGLGAVGEAGSRSKQATRDNMNTAKNAHGVGTRPSDRHAIFAAEGSSVEEAGTDGSSGGTDEGSGVYGGVANRPLGIGTAPRVENRMGRFMPHLVLVSLQADGTDGRQARIVQAAAMDSISAKQVTSVKLSPSARYILLGAGVRARYAGARRVADARRAGRPQGNGPAGQGGGGGGISSQPPVTSIYRAANLQPVNMMPSADDDVNIACFHPDPGMGCVFGTKQGRVCIVRMAD